MKCLIAWFAGVFLILTLAGLLSAQDQKKTSAKEDRLSGTVHTIDKDTSSIILRKGAIQRRLSTTLKRNSRSRIGQVPSTM
jgi:hypothetical protein